LLRRLQDELAGRFGELRVVPALVDGGRPVQLAQVREAAGRLDGSLSGGEGAGAADGGGVGGVLPPGHHPAASRRRPAMTVANVRSAMCDLYDEGKSGTSRTLSPAGQIG